MKNTTCLCRPFLFLLLIAMGCSKDDGVDPGNQPLVTQVGIPTGTLNYGTFNETGGTLTSADGVVQLVIPAGALSHEEVLSIQPLSNFSPGGVGNSYRLLPGGLTFHQPVTLIFNYADSLVAEEQFLGIAYQHTDHTWFAPVVYTLNEAANTVSVQTTHFSDWSAFEKLAIHPLQSNVLVSETKLLEVVLVGALNTITSSEGIALNNLNIENNITTTWQVGAGSIIKEGNDKARFTAPASVPSPNPVEVSVTFNNVSFDFHGTTFTNPTLHARVRVVANLLYYQVVFTSSRSIEPVGSSWFTEIDSGSMKLYVIGDSVTVYDRINLKAIITPTSLYDPGPECATAVVDQGDGPYHMPEEITYGGYHSSFNHQIYVGVTGQTYPSGATPTFSKLCTGGTEVIEGGDILPTAPTSFSFDANLQSQVINQVIPGGGAFPDGYLRTTITRIQ